MNNIVLKNGEKWLDTDGNIIHAHGGGIIKKGDTYIVSVGSESGEFEAN